MTMGSLRPKKLNVNVVFVLIAISAHNDEKV